MDYNNEKSEVYSQKIRAGKRTYFFDVKATRSNDYYITITESKRKFGGEGYDKHKVFVYKEDFNKFLTTLVDTINHVKTQLLPDYDYDEFDREPEIMEDDRKATPVNIAADTGSDGAPEDDPGTTWEE